MRLVKNILLVSLGLGLCLSTTSAYATQGPIVAAIQKLGVELKDYFSTTKAKDDEDKKKLAIQDAPSFNMYTNDEGRRSYELLTIIDKLMKEKEVQDINFSMYLTPRIGEKASLDPLFKKTQNHMHYFCSPFAGTELKNFEKHGCNKDKDITTQHADLKVSNLLDPEAYDASLELLADEVIRNITSHTNINIESMIRQDMIENRDNIRIFAEYLDKQRELATARYSFNKAFAIRKKIAIKGELSESQLQRRRKALTQRVKNPEWRETVNQSSTQALLKELVYIQNTHLSLEDERELRFERMEILLASLLAQISILVAERK